MKKSKRLLTFLIITIIIFIICFLAYSFLFNDSKEKEVKIIKSIQGYNYNLNENETEIYKNEFNNLDEILSKDDINYEEYAISIAKLFIIDFYTLDNKVSKNDIGGVDFIKESMKDNFIEEARSTFYKYLEVKTDNRSQSLPVVSKITDVSIEETKFTYTDKTIDENAYKVTISWNYKEELGYENSANMIIVKENKKLYIVEMD